MCAKIGEFGIGKLWVLFRRTLKKEGKIMELRISTVKIILIINCCLLLGYSIASCSGPKKIIETPPIVKEVEEPFDPAKFFDASALRIYNMSASYPNTLQKRMLTASLDSLQIKLTTQTKSNSGALQYQTDAFEPMQNSMVEMGMMGKLVLALACARKMEAYKIEGIKYSSTIIIESAGRDLPGTYNDPFAPQGRPSLAQYLARMLMHNDVDAYNRILEFVTIEGVNEFAKFNGWNSTTITSRLGRTYSSSENASMNTINFYDDNNRKIFIQPNSFSSQSKIKTRYANTTSLDDMESIVLSLCTNQFRNKDLNSQIGEDRLEYLKLLLFNPQTILNYAGAANQNATGSLFFPNLKPSDKLMLLPITVTNDSGMSEVLYYNDLKTGKVFILSASLLFKYSEAEKGFEKELKDGRQMFEDLGKATLSQRSN